MVLLFAAHAKIYVLQVKITVLVQHHHTECKFGSQGPLDMQPINFSQLRMLS